MIFDADDLLGDLEQRAGAEAPATTFDRAAVVGALVEADRLAGDDPRAQPAALFFALARRSRSFGKLAANFVPDVARACAVGRGLELTAGIELDIYRLRILRGEMTFDQLREAFATRLRPFGL
jgi:hypothetical protein